VWRHCGWATSGSDTTCKTCGSAPFSASRPHPVTTP
jgi:hypothetical protein